MTLEPDFDSVEGVLDVFTDDASNLPSVSQLNMNFWVVSLTDPYVTSSTASRRAVLLFRAISEAATVDVTATGLGSILFIRSEADLFGGDWVVKDGTGKS